MYTLSFLLLLAFEVFAFITFLVIMYFFKGPWRKWICFGAAFISIWFLLDAGPALYADDAYSLEWRMFKFVSFVGVIMIAGMGFLDLRKTNLNREVEDMMLDVLEESSVEAQHELLEIQTDEVSGKKVDVSPSNASSSEVSQNVVSSSDVLPENREVEDKVPDVVEGSSVEAQHELLEIQTDEVNESKVDVSPSDASSSEVPPYVVSSSDVLSAVSSNKVDDEGAYDNEPDELTRQRVLSQSKQDYQKMVLPWLYEQISQFSQKEQNYIKACVENFLDNRNVDSLEETISNEMSPYTQQRLYEIVSAFILLGKSRKQCAIFAKEVFANFFLNTEITTIERKLIGENNIQLIIDDYWEIVRKKQSN